MSQAHYGDIIGVDRGFYQHYGVYVSPDCVIEYGSENGDFGGEIRVQAVSLQKFLNQASEYFVCAFSPETQLVNPDDSVVDWLQQLYRTIKGERYHLYTPEETVQRAKSKLGETKYNLMLNNCEHFAIWCKTGVSESMQVQRVLRIAGRQLLRAFRTGSVAQRHTTALSKLFSNETAVQQHTADKSADVRPKRHGASGRG